MEQTDRLFGRCTVSGCKARAILHPDGSMESRGPVVVNEELGYAACTEHVDGFFGTPFPMMWKGIKATKNDHECDATCRLSFNPVCKCSCGGANHGTRGGVG